jgi:hypothetical protein
MNFRLAVIKVLMFKMRLSDFDLSCLDSEELLAVIKE